MGLLPEIHHAWLSIDNKLYLWNYAFPSDFTTFDGLDQLIVTVGLVAPKPGVCKENVHYLLVIATTVEIVILGLTVRQEENLTTIQLKPSPFYSSSDNVSMLKIQGTQNGRIFMAGKDGVVYELEYDTSEGIMQSLGFKNKCRKLNRSSYAVTNLIPPFLKAIPSYIAGSSSSIIDLVVDNIRYLLYALTSNGEIEVYDLGNEGNDMKFVHYRRKNIFQMARTYCEQCQQRSIPAPDPRLFESNFLNQFEIKIIQIFVIPPTESKSINVAAVSSNGFRFYFTTNYHTDFARAKMSSGFPRPKTLDLVHVRGPPSSTLWDTLRSSSASSGPEQPLISHTEGFPPQDARTTGPQIQAIHHAYYNNGISLFANGESESGDLLVGICPDLLNRKSAVSSLWDGQEQIPMMRENVCEIGNNRTNTREERLLLPGKVWDIREVSSVPIPLQGRDHSGHWNVLLASSRTPIESELGDYGSLRIQPKSSIKFHAPTLVTSPLIANQGHDPSAGLTHDMLLNIIPLYELVTQTIPGQRRFLFLTNAGIHVISKLRPIDHLYRLLRQNKDNKLQDFFNSFGQDQACAMCLAISCGVPSDCGVVLPLTGHGVGGLQASTTFDGSNTNIGREEVQKRAIRALFMFGGVPNIASSEVVGSLSHRPSSHSLLSQSRPIYFDEVTFSSHHNGLMLIVSRLLRPILYQPLIRMETEFLPYSQKGRLRPNILLDRQEIAQLQKSIAHLIDFMRNNYSSAIDHDLLRRKSEDERNSLMMQMRMQNTTRLNDPSIDARRMEELSLHKLYRFISRVSQALSLLDTLFYVHELPAPDAVKWSELANMTFAEIVTSPKAHAKIGHLLQRIIDPSVMNFMVSDIAIERITQRLSSECYFFFSEGDRLYFDARKVLSAAKVAFQGTVERKQYCEKVVDLIKKAAKFWKSTDHVNENGVLYSFCQELRVLELYTAIVDLCLISSTNFGGSISSKIQSNIKGIPELLANDETPPSTWEFGIYHGGFVLNDQERQNAKENCYAIILTFLEQLFQLNPQVGAGVVQIKENSLPLSEREGIANEMIQRSLHSQDADYHYMLYNFLKNINSENLVRIESSFIENYLQKEDPMLLWRYFDLHDRHIDAMNLMDSLAHTPDNTPLEKRIAHVTRAINSAKTCIQRMPNSNDRTATVLITERLTTLEEQLEIAIEQKRLLDLLQSDTDRMKEMLLRLDSTINTIEYDTLQQEINDRKEIIARIATNLVDISELYNQVAYPFNMWESCLSILHICNYDDDPLIIQLWKAIIYREVPEECENPRTLTILQRMRESVMQDPYKIPSSGTFEDENWISTLKHKVSSLGRNFSAPGTNHTFPIKFICEELENLSWLYDETSEARNVDSWKNWVVMTMIEAGVPFSFLYQNFIEIFFRMETREPSKQLHCLRSICDILFEWTQKLTIRSVANSEAQELIYRWRSSLSNQITDFKSSLQALHGRGVDITVVTNCLMKLRQVELAIQRILEV